MGIQDVIRWFLPREDHFYGFLERQAKKAQEGATALSKFSPKGQDAVQTRAEVQKIEHEGDAIVREMEEALAKTFVTPIDREDLQKLSSELDTVLDLTNGAIRSCALMGVEHPTDAMAKLIAILVRCTTKLDEAIPKLRTHKYHDMLEIARELRQIEKEADEVYREEVSRLFRNGVSQNSFDARVLIREKSVLEDLENAIDQCDSIADTLTNLAVKNG